MVVRCTTGTVQAIHRVPGIFARGILLLVLSGAFCLEYGHKISLPVLALVLLLLLQLLLLMQLLLLLLLPLCPPAAFCCRCGPAVSAAAAAVCRYWYIYTCVVCNHGPFGYHTGQHQKSPVCHSSATVTWSVGWS